MIRTFIAKRLIHEFIHHIVAQVKTKFHHESEAESSQSMQSLIAGIDSLLLAEDGVKKKEKGRNELCEFPRYKILSGTNLVVVTKELHHTIYCYIYIWGCNARDHPKSHQEEGSLLLLGSD